MIIAKKIPANIIDSNVDVKEDGITVWDSSDTYTTKDIVQVNGNVNKKYRAIQDVKAGINPATDVDVTTGYGSYWFEIGATNYTKAFDESNSSACKNTDTINYKFSISDVDVLVILGVKAEKITLKITNEDTNEVALDETYTMQGRDVSDWFDWSYAQIEYKNTFYKRLPLIYNATLEVTIDNTDDIAEVAHIAYGRSKNYGLTLADPAPVTSRRSVTSKTRNEFGEIVTRKKARYKRMIITCLIDSTTIDVIEDRFESIVDTPCIFVGDERDEGYKSLLIYGEMKDHDMPIGISKTKYQLEVEGYI